MQMTCPKCQGQMRQYERSGVTVDQCTECRGIFLDRGELEKLFDAETNWNKAQANAPQSPGGAPAPAPSPGHAPQPPGSYVPPPPPPPQHGYPAPAPAYGQPAYGGHYRGHYHHRKQRSFLHDLFD
ncbi:MAG TPA: zf-TFIIB domain-containing protein [Micromonosporaceae bacterium]|nr:zf-TFIIB domain-containing protein [Micromonosporaceae bacterium]